MMKVPRGSRLTPVGSAFSINTVIFYHIIDYGEEICDSKTQTFTDWKNDDELT